MSIMPTPGSNCHESNSAVMADNTPCWRSGFSPEGPRFSGHSAPFGGEKRSSSLSPLLPTSRKLYVYLHIDPESLKNAEFSEPHPSICLGSYPSFACHSRFAILASGIRDERVRELAA